MISFTGSNATGARIMAGGGADDEEVVAGTRRQGGLPGVRRRRRGARGGPVGRRDHHLRPAVHRGEARAGARFEVRSDEGGAVARAVFTGGWRRGLAGRSRSACSSMPPRERSRRRSSARWPKPTRWSCEAAGRGCWRRAASCLPRWWHTAIPVPSSCRKRSSARWSSSERFEDEAEAVARQPQRILAWRPAWTHDGARAMRVARALRNGTVWINDHNKLFAEAETGGYRRSGLGRLRGVDAPRRLHRDQTHLPERGRRWRLTPAPEELP